MSNELVVTALVFLGSCTLTFVVLLWMRDRRLRRSVVRGLRSGADRVAAVPILRMSSAYERPRMPLMARFGRVIARWLPKNDHLRSKLIRAGWESQLAPLTFAGIRFWLIVSLTMLSATVGYVLDRPPQQIILWTALGFLAGWALPEFVVQRRTRLRRKRIRKSLPDALDLLVVCVEAGVGLDGAILRVADELANAHPDIAHEFRMINHRVNAGIPRTEALRELVQRTLVDDIRSIVTTLIQSEKLGVSIGRVLRVESAALRTKRRQEAEQNARKAPIKMLVPLILFVLPALMTVILGPAGIHLIRVLRTTGQ